MVLRSVITELAKGWVKVGKFINVRVHHGSPVRTKMDTGKIALFYSRFVGYKSLGHVGISCGRIYNNLILELHGFLTNRDF